MNSRAYCLLGKNGDIINILPILRHEAEVTGKPQVLIVAKQFADLLSGCSYVKPCIWNNHWFHLNEALYAAKRKFKQVIALGTFGVRLPIQQRTPSFQLDQWLRAGCLSNFHEWPLVFDRRNQMNEQELADKYLSKDKPTILFGDYGESGPFAQVGEITTRIKQAFNDRYQVLRLSEVRGWHIYDVLGLYDRAAALVTVDTAHLHLGHGSKVPKLVFGVDSRNGWGASVYRPDYKFYSFYSDAPNRITDLIAALDDLDRGEREPEIFHAWTAGKRTWDDKNPSDQRTLLAMQTWVEEGKNHKWTSCQHEQGGFRHLGESEGRLPRIRDMIDHAASKAKFNDIILLTNSDTCVAPGFAQRAKDAVKKTGAFFCHRWDFQKLTGRLDAEQIREGQWYPGSDAFGFTKGWWYCYRKWYPDMVVGREWWDMVMRTLIKLTGGTELEHGIYHERHASKWEQNKQLAGNIHNAKLAADFVAAWGHWL